MTLIHFVATDGRGWDHMDGWGGGWMWLWGTLMMVGLVFLAVWLVRVSTASNPAPEPSNPTDPAKRILSERFARGELNAEEYRERLDELIDR